MGELELILRGRRLCLLHSRSLDWLQGQGLLQWANGRLGKEQEGQGPARLRSEFFILYFLKSYKSSFEPN